MKIKWFLFGLTVLLVSLIYFTLSDFFQQTPPKRVGVLLMNDSRMEKYRGLKAGIEQAGFHYTDIIYIKKNADDQPEKLEDAIKELVQAKPNVIVTTGAIETTELANYLKEHNQKVPVIFAGMADPKDLGIVRNYHSTDTWFTGVNNHHTSMSAKRLELLHELVPSVKKVVVLYDQTIDASIKSLAETRKAADLLGIELIAMDSSTNAYMNKLRSGDIKADAIMTMPSFRIESQTDTIVALSDQLGIPVMGTSKKEVEQGFLAAYGTSFYDQGKQTARFVSAVLQGNHPSDLPIELPDQIRLMVNRQEAERLNIKLKADVLYIAEYISDSSGRKAGDAE